MKSNTRGGFTLIELLVVISIIGLLSSVVLASLQSARQKGQVASIIEFTTHNYRKLGANTLFNVDFNNKSPIDSTGNFPFSGMTFSGSGVYANTLNPFADNGWYFDGSGIVTYTYKTSNSTPLPLPDQIGIAYSFWFNGAQSNATIIRFYDATNSNLFVGGLNSNYYPFCSYLSTAPSASVSANDSNWHNITCAYDASSGKLSLYYDGRLSQSSSPISPPPDISSIGFRALGGGYSISIINGSKGYFDNIQIFSGSLTAQAVEKLYAEGLKTHPNLAQK